MSNKLDPIHAVASLSLAFIEAQKDISQMRRQLDTLFDQLRTVDQATAVKFKEVDTYIDKMSREISSLLIKEVPNADNKERGENTCGNVQNVSVQEES